MNLFSRVAGYFGLSGDAAAGAVDGSFFAGTKCRYIRARAHVDGQTLCIERIVEEGDELDEDEARDMRADFPLSSVSNVGSVQPDTYGGPGVMWYARGGTFVFRCDNDGTRDALRGHIEDGTASSEAPDVHTAPILENADVVSPGCRLDEYDAQKRAYDTLAKDVQAAVSRLPPGSSATHALVVVARDGKPLLQEPLVPSLIVHSNTSEAAVSWLSLAVDDGTEGSAQRTFTLRFASHGAYRAFVTVLSRRRLENRRGGEVPDSEAEYLCRADEDDVEMEDAERRPAYGESDDDDNEEEFEEETHAARVGQSADTKNSLLTVGYRDDRSFVVRGSKIGVFQTAEDGDVQHVTTINSVATPSRDRAVFSPARAMLAQQDSSLLLLSPSHPDKVYRMDLHRGEVVEEWGTNDAGLACREISHVNKTAETSEEQTFLGLAPQAIYRMDPRVNSKNKAVAEETKMYARSTKANLNCIATTSSGAMAVGSEHGDIRLFSPGGVNKNAKTQLPGLGDPILGMDTTADGKWVLATTKTYLMLVPTEFVDAKTKKVRQGFDARMGANKPVPRKLFVLPEDLAHYGIADVSFTPAHFNRGANGDTSIVTSTGKFLVTWDFLKVRRGRIYDYTIKIFTENIVADDFRYNSAGEVVVATANDVALARKRQAKHKRR